MAEPRAPSELAASLAALGAVKARVLVDPNVLNAKGTTAIDWYVPSPDGRLVT